LSNLKEPIMDAEKTEASINKRRLGHQKHVLQKEGAGGGQNNEGLGENGNAEAKALNRK